MTNSQQTELANHTNAITIAMPSVPALTTVEAVKELSRLAVQSGMSKAKHPADAFFIAMYGMELGIPPMTAMRTIYSVKGGAPTCSGEAMLSLLRRSGKVRITLPNPVEVKDSATVTIERIDTGEKGSFTFTMDMARKAGLVRDGSPWTTYPHMMLIWRAVSMGAKLLASDIIGGLYTVEEIYTETQVDENGEPIGDIIYGEASRSTSSDGSTITQTPRQQPTSDPVTPAGVARVFDRLGVPKGTENYAPYLSALGISKFGEFDGTMTQLETHLEATHRQLRQPTPAITDEDGLLAALNKEFEGVTRREIITATGEESWESLMAWASKDFDSSVATISAALDSYFASSQPAQPKQSAPAADLDEFDMHDIIQTCLSDFNLMPKDALKLLGKASWGEFSKASVAKDALRNLFLQQGMPVVAHSVTHTGDKNRWLFDTAIGPVGFFGRDLLRTAYANSEHLPTIEGWTSAGDYTLPKPLIVSWVKKGDYINADGAIIPPTQAPVNHGAFDEQPAADALSEQEAAAVPF
jgi:hypothetical protein